MQVTADMMPKVCQIMQKYAKVGKSKQHYENGYTSMLKYNNMQKYSTFILME